MLVGHLDQRAAFLEALDSGRMHHAWLIAGPRGIGKRRFADWAALKLLSGTTGTADVDPEDPAARLIASSGHPDHRVLSPPDEGKGSATAAIPIDDVRALSDFLHSYPALAGWRTLIIDALDNMNINAANAFLKELEEPRQKTVYLLVTHAPGRLLPTIRSRCRMLRMQALTDSESAQVIRAQIPDSEPAAVDGLARISEGAPGRVLGLAGADVVGLDAVVDRMIAGVGAPAAARGFQGQSALPKLEALALLVPQRIAAAARKIPSAELLDLYDEALAIARDTVRLADDRVQVAMALADIMAQVGRIERLGRAQ